MIDSPRLPRTLRAAIAGAVVVVLVVVAACSGTSQVDQEQAGSDAESASPTDRATPAPDEPSVEDPPSDEAKPIPVPFRPGGQVGSAQAYEELIAELEADVPVELRDLVPWPDLRNPDPVVAQNEIFELWVWMADNYPEPALVPAMTAPDSPSRDDVIIVFGDQHDENVLERRIDQPYRAFDHRVVTFESAGLPLWLARDVPLDAVVVYYDDSAGATEVRDRDTGEVLLIRPPVPTRTWLSIMVPTEAGWRLWRDELIEPNDAELQVPDTPPGEADERPKPQV